MNNDLISREGKAEYIEVMPRFEEFDNRNDDCDQCPFFDEECSGDGDKRCFSADILELLKRGHDLEMDAEPVRHGRWIETVPAGWHGSGYYSTPKISCPFCNEEPIPFTQENHEHGGTIVSYQWVKTRHCPNCGAKMDEEVDD